MTYNKIILLSTILLLINLPAISCQKLTAATITIKALATAKSDPLLSSSKIQGYYTPLGDISKLVGNLFKVSRSRIYSF